MSDTESNPVPIGVADAPILAGNGSPEAEYAPPPSGLDDGVAARTRHRLRLRHDEGGRQEIIDPVRIDASRTRPSDDPTVI